MPINPYTGMEEDDDFTVNMSPDLGGTPEMMPQPQAAVPAQAMNPMVKDYLMKKFDYGEYSDENRKKLAEESQPGFGDKAQGVLAALGAGFMGRDPAAAKNAVLARQAAERQGKLSEFDKGRAGKIADYKLAREEQVAQREDDKFDPLSKQSVAFRKSIEANFPRIREVYGDNWNNVTAGDQESIFKPLQLKEQVDARKQAAAILAGQRKDALTAKTEEKNDKKKQMMFEIEDRRQNINSALDELDGMIKEDGTWEAFGSHNQDLERLIEGVATDMAKLQDPNSVARPSEVDAVKKNLVASGFKNSNATARKILQNFKGEVARRADSAYKVRGLESPYGATITEGGSVPETKVVGGVTYKKVPGGWEEVSTVGQR